MSCSSSRVLGGSALVTGNQLQSEQQHRIRVRREERRGGGEGGREGTTDL